VQLFGDSIAVTRSLSAVFSVLALPCMYWLSLELFESSVTKNFLMVQAPGFIRGINPKSQIENPQAPAFIRGVNLKSRI
jgi:hypothetical protein